MKPYDIVILGDVNLDYCVSGNLDFTFSSLRENGRISWQKIEERPGGTGLNFALYAKKRGFNPLLIGCVANDHAGHILLDYLSRVGLSEGISTHANTCTGKAIIVRDANDIRLLVDNEINANRLLSTADVERHAEAIRGAALIYISGYCIKDRSAPRFSAVQKAVEVAAGGQTAIAFDVVPHRIYEVYTLDELRQAVPRVDILISEVTTVRRFLGMGTPAETVDEAVSKETLEALKPYLERFVLRWGPSGVDDEIIWDGLKGQIFRRSHDHSHAEEKRGFGDQITLEVIENIFNFKPAQPSDST